MASGGPSSMYVKLMKCEFDYEAATEEELSVKEDDIVWVIEDDDPDWYKVKIKDEAGSTPAVGLVPASYLTPYPVTRTVRASFDYAPARLDTGELENEEEMEIAEGETLDLLIDEGDWSLVAKSDGRSVGFVPANYLEDADGATAPPAASAYDDQPEEEEETEAPVAAGAYVDPSERVAAARSAPSSSEVETWPVTEIDKKKKKKKGTLGVGNGTVFFASESDKTPVQQYSLSSLTDLTSEKSKHLYLTFPSAGELHFSIGSKEAFDAIVEKIEEGRAQPRHVPPPPPSVPSALPAAGVPAASTYVPPPPPIRGAAAPAPPRSPSPEPEPEPEEEEPMQQAEEAVDDSLNGDAVALYDFEPQAADEIAIAEGDRLFYIPDGSDDPDWAKVRKVGSMEEGVVPATYIQLDNEGASVPAAQPQAPAPAAPIPPPAPPVAAPAAAAAAAAASATRARAPMPVPASRDVDEEDDEEAARRADEEALAAQIERDAKAQRDRERAAKEKSRRERDAARARRKEAEAEAARSQRLSSQPHAAPIPVPQPGDTDDEAISSTRRRDRSSRSAGTTKEGLKKPVASRVRTWRDRTGQFKVDAEFLGMNGKKIRLHKVNGVVIEVPVEKMSPEDTSYIKKLLAKDQQPNGGEYRSREASSASRTNGAAAAAKPKRPQTDWFEFFLNAGCDLDDCTRYANNFEREKMEESILIELESATMRSLGLREGDIIRVRKHIRDKFGPPPTPDKSDREAQIAADAQLAKALQGPSPPPPNLFTGADGGLKTTRRGRPARSGSSAVDPATLANASTELAKKAGTPAPEPRVASPAPAASTEPAKSVSSGQNGFDDDAWTVKTPAKAVSPPPAAAAPPKAPSPPPAPAAAAAPAPSPAATETTRPASAASDSGSGLTYNDGLLAQLGIGPGASSSTNSAAAQQQRDRAPSNPVSPQRSTFDPSAPRGPLAPVPANQGLLAPLIPTRTGMPGYQPTGFGAGLMPQATGYSAMSPSMGMNSMAPLSQQFTGMNISQSPFAGGIPMQATGFQPSPSPNFLASQPTGMPSYMSPQQTGMSSMSSGSFNGYNSQPQPQQALQPQRTGFVEFNPMPPNRQQQPSSNDSQKFEAKNVFASMKDGSFASGKDSHLGPQDASKYEILRPQVTGYAQQQPGMGMMQPQMTGYPGQQQQGIFPQQTGIQWQQNGYRQY